MRFIWLHLLFIFFLVVPTDARQAFVATDRDSLFVGDRLNYSIVLYHDDQEAVYPDSAAFGEDFEFLSREIIRLGNRDSVVYHLQFFGTEHTAIPELSVGQLQNGDTTWVAVPDYPITFVSLVDSESSPFRPMKPLYEFSASPWPIILFVIALLLIGVGGYYYYKSRPVQEEPEVQKAPEPPPPFHDPLKALEDEVNAIYRKFPDPSADYKLWFSKLGDAIRRYFEFMYAIPALESTTREVMIHLNKNLVDDQLSEHCRKFLVVADRVKFAKFTPDSDDTQRAQELISLFVKRARDVDGSRIEMMREQYQAHLAELRNETKQKAGGEQ